MTMPVMSADERAAKIRNLVGPDVSITTAMFDVQKMLERYLLIDLDLHGFSVMLDSIKFSELGLETGDARRDRATPGRRLLFPKEIVARLQTLETQYRDMHKRYTLQVSIFGGWACLCFEPPEEDPDGPSAYDEYLARKAELDERLADLKREVIGAYDEYMEQNQRFFERAARSSWRDMQSRYPNGAAVPTDFGTFEPGEEEKFVEVVTMCAMGRMPRVEDIEGIRADYKTALLFTTQEAAVMVAEEKRARSEAATAAAIATQEQYKEFTEKQRAEVRREAVFAAEMEHARQQLGEFVSPLQEAINTLRAQIYDDATQIAAAIRKSGKVHPKTAQRIQNIIRTYELMGVGDVELKKVLIDLKKSTRATGGGAVTEVVAALDSAVELTSAAAKSVIRREKMASSSTAGAVEL